MMASRHGVLLMAALLLAPASFGQASMPIEQVLRERAGLTEGELLALRRGDAVAKILPSAADTIYAFGVVYINATPDEYLRFATDINRLKRLPQYLGAGTLSATPAIDELRGFELDAGDIRELRRCKAGDCEIQLPFEAIEQFRRAIDWSRPDVAAQVNQHAKEMALEVVRRYRQGGSAMLGAYNDRDKSAGIAETFRELLDGSARLAEFLPDLDRYLLNYPNARLANAESSFYWERVDFGLKPTLRINHAVSYHTRVANGEAYVLAVKQLYASHYFRAALDLSVCLRDPSSKGFYLISLRGSSQDGLTGFMGSLLRRRVVSKTRSSQEGGLAGIKRALEGLR